MPTASKRTRAAKSKSMEPEPPPRPLPAPNTYQPKHPRSNDTVEELHLPNKISYEVVQQPEDQGAWVTGRDNTATQFRKAQEFGVTGLLAHNSLAGRQFSQLEIGSPLRVVRDGGKSENATVQEIHRFQALTPNSPYSAFKDLDTGKTYTAAQLFMMMYGQEGNPVVLQTCIEKDGDLNWGRMFIVAN